MSRTRIEALLARARLTSLSDLVSRPTVGRTPVRALDGLRGLAVGVVLASHTGGLNLVGHGAAGVWLFFCLSAFLLTLPFVEAPKRILRLRNLRVYAVRRALRILPAYYLALAVHAMVLDWDSRRLFEHLIFVRGDGILWTLPQEVLFYLLLPLLLFLHPLVFRNRTGITIAALAGLAAASNLFLDATVFSLDSRGKALPFHLGIFLTGMTFAYAVHWSPLRRWVTRLPINRALGIVGLVLLVMFAFSGKYWVIRYASWMPFFGSLHPNWSNHYPGSFGVLCGTVVYLTVVCEGRLLARFLSSLALRALGLVSFSVYLFHYMVRNELAKHTVVLGTELLIGTLVLSYLIGSVSYIFVERPMIRLGRRRDSSART